ncbi:hypothetical protein LINGRAHAP2_LOCUS17273 [Linum grandiflorum]
MDSYAIWSFHLQFIIEGKELVDFLDGTAKKPTEEATTAAKKTWKTNNAKVFSWSLGSIESNIALTLRTVDCAASVWTHLQKTYSQTNQSRVFEVEYDIAKLSQGELDVRSFYNAAAQLWTEQDLISESTLTAEVSADIRKERQRSRILQFLMKLRLEFESARSQLISSNTSDVDKILGDLVWAETRMKTQAKLDGSIVEGGSIFAAYRGSSTRPQFSASQQFNSVNQSTPNGEGDSRYHHCNETGHFRNHCRKTNFCTYCKKIGHIILDCARAKGRRSSSVGGSNCSGGGTANF